MQHHCNCDEPPNLLCHAHWVEWTAWVAVLCALEGALKAQEAAWLTLAAWLQEICPALALNKAAQEQLHSQQRACGETGTRANNTHTVVMSACCYN